MLKCYQIDDGERHWIAAETEENALSLCVKLFEFKSVEEYRLYFDPVVTILPLDKNLTIYSDSDDTKTKTIGEWLSLIENEELMATTAY